MDLDWALKRELAMSNLHIRGRCSGKGDSGNGTVTQFGMLLDPGFEFGQEDVPPYTFATHVFADCMALVTSFG